MEGALDTLLQAAMTFEAARAEVIPLLQTVRQRLGDDRPLDGSLDSYVAVLTDLQSLAQSAFPAGRRRLQMTPSQALEAARVAAATYEGISGDSRGTELVELLIRAETAVETAARQNPSIVRALEGVRNELLTTSVVSLTSDQITVDALFSMSLQIKSGFEQLQTAPPAEAAATALACVQTVAYELNVTELVGIIAEVTRQVERIEAAVPPHMVTMAENILRSHLANLNNGGAAVDAATLRSLTALAADDGAFSKIAGLSQWAQSAMGGALPAASGRRRRMQAGGMMGIASNMGGMMDMMGSAMPGGGADGPFAAMGQMQETMDKMSETMAKVEEMSEKISPVLRRLHSGMHQEYPNSACCANSAALDAVGPPLAPTEALNVCQELAKRAQEIMGEAKDMSTVGKALTGVKLIKVGMTAAMPNASLAFIPVIEDIMSAIDGFSAKYYPVLYTIHSSLAEDCMVASGLRSASGKGCPSVENLPVPGTGTVGVDEFSQLVFDLGRAAMDLTSGREKPVTQMLQIAKLIANCLDAVSPPADESSGAVSVINTVENAVDTVEAIVTDEQIVDIITKVHHVMTRDPRVLPDPGPRVFPIDAVTGQPVIDLDDVVNMVIDIVQEVQAVFDPNDPMPGVAIIVARTVDSQLEEGGVIEAATIAMLEMRNMMKNGVSGGGMMVVLEQVIFAVTGEPMTSETNPITVEVKKAITMLMNATGVDLRKIETLPDQLERLAVSQANGLLASTALAPVMNKVEMVQNNITMMQQKSAKAKAMLEQAAAAADSAAAVAETSRQALETVSGLHATLTNANLDSAWPSAAGQIATRRRLSEGGTPQLGGFAGVLGGDVGSLLADLNSFSNVYLAEPSTLDSIFGQDCSDPNQECQRDAFASKVSAFLPMLTAVRTNLRGAHGVIQALPLDTGPLPAAVEQVNTLLQHRQQLRDALDVVNSLADFALMDADEQAAMLQVLIPEMVDEALAAFGNLSSTLQPVRDAWNSSPAITAMVDMLPKILDKVNDADKVIAMVNGFSNISNTVDNFARTPAFRAIQQGAAKVQKAIEPAQEWVGVHIEPKIAFFHGLLTNVSIKIHEINAMMDHKLQIITWDLDNRTLLANRPPDWLTPCNVTNNSLCIRIEARPDVKPAAPALLAPDGTQLIPALPEIHNFHRDWVFPIRYAHLKDLSRNTWRTPGIYDEFTAQSTIPLLDKRTRPCADGCRVHTECIQGLCVFGTESTDGSFPQAELLLLSMHASGSRKAVGQSSVFLVMDGDSGEILKVFELKDELGQNFTGTVGGLAIVEGTVWTTDDSRNHTTHVRNNLIMGFPLDDIFDGLGDGTVIDGDDLVATKRFHVDVRPDSLHYDDSPTEQMLWVTEYVMDAFEEDEESQEKKKKKRKKKKKGATSTAAAQPDEPPTGALVADNVGQCEPDNPIRIGDRADLIAGPPEPEPETSTSLADIVAEMKAAAMGATNSDYLATNYLGSCHHIGTDDGRGWSVGYSASTLSGRSDAPTYTVDGESVLVPEEIIKVGPYVQGMAKVTAMSVEYVVLLRCASLNDFTCKLEFHNTTRDVSEDPSGCVWPMGNLGYKSTRLNMVKRILAVPHGASDINVGLTGLELFLTIEGAAVEWKETMAAIKADIDDRIFMLRIPQTENRKPQIIRNEKYLQLFGVDVFPPAAFAPQFPYVPLMTGDEGEDDGSPQQASDGTQPACPPKLAASDGSIDACEALDAPFGVVPYDDGSGKNWLDDFTLTNYCGMGADASACWEVRTSRADPDCGGYEEFGYTCVDDYCAIMDSPMGSTMRNCGDEFQACLQSTGCSNALNTVDDPQTGPNEQQVACNNDALCRTYMTCINAAQATGDPHLCAAMMAPGTVVDEATGRCKGDLSFSEAFAADTLMSIMEQDRAQRDESDICFDIIVPLMAPTTTTFLDFTLTFPVFPGVAVFLNFVLGGGMSVDMWGSACISSLTTSAAVVPTMWIDAEINGGLQILVTRAGVGVEACILNVSLIPQGTLSFATWPLTGKVMVHKLERGITAQGYVFLQFFVCIKLCESLGVTYPCGLDWCEKMKKPIEALKYEAPDNIYLIYEKEFKTPDTTPPIGEGEVEWVKKKGTVTISWTGWEEEESTISHYIITVGNALGTDDLVGAIEVPADEMSAIFFDEELEIPDGILACFNVQACNGNSVPLCSGAGLCKMYDAGPPVPNGLQDGLLSSDRDAQRDETELTARYDSATDVTNITTGTWGIGICGLNSTGVLDDVRAFETFEPNSHPGVFTHAMRLKHAQTFCVTVCLLDSLGYEGCYTTDGVTVDLTPPEPRAVYDIMAPCDDSEACPIFSWDGSPVVGDADDGTGDADFQSSLNTKMTRWVEWYDPESVIVKYEYRITDCGVCSGIGSRSDLLGLNAPDDAYMTGCKEDETELVPWTEVGILCAGTIPHAISPTLQPADCSQTWTNLTLTPYSERYCTYVRGTNEALWTSEAGSDGVEPDPDPPVCEMQVVDNGEFQPDDRMFETELDKPLSAHWRFTDDRFPNENRPITHFTWAVGTSFGDTDMVPTTRLTDPVSYSSGEFSERLSGINAPQNHVTPGPWLTGRVNPDDNRE